MDYISSVLPLFKMWYFFWSSGLNFILVLVFSHTLPIDLLLRFMIFGKVRWQAFAELFSNWLKPGKRDKLVKQHTPEVSHLVRHKKCRFFQTHGVSSFRPIWSYSYYYFSIIRERKIMTVVWCAVSVIQTPICCFIVLILSVSNSLVKVVDYDNMYAVHSNQNYSKFELSL